MRNAGLEEAQAGIKSARKISINLRYVDGITLMAESEEELKSLLMKVKEESGKVGLKLTIQKTKIMASSSITSWQIDGETVKTVSDFIFGGSKITADGDCSHDIKRHLLLGRKVMPNLDSILKSRHYFVNKGPSSQGYGFSCGHVRMWEMDCEEGWALKNWCFWTVVLEKTLESLLNCKEIQPVHPKGNQSWVFIGMEKAMATHSSTLAWKIPWTEEPGRLQSMGSLRVRHDWATWLSLFTFMHWRRKWQTTPLFLPGESQGQGSLVGCRLWSCTESDATEAT